MGWSSSHNSESSNCFSCALSKLEPSFCSALFPAKTPFHLNSLTMPEMRMIPTDFSSLGSSQESYSSGSLRLPEESVSCQSPLGVGDSEG